MIAELGLALRLSRGYLLRPWKSPYLRWRIETWSGLDARGIGPLDFIRFTLKNRAELWRYLQWAVRTRP